MAQPPVMFQQAVVPMPITSQQRKKREYASRVAIGLGTTQILLGTAAIGLGIAEICVEAALYMLGMALWCGVFFIVSGSIEIASGKTRRRCLIMACMVLSILSAVACAAMLAMYTFAVMLDSNRTYFNERGFTYHYGVKQVLVDSLIIVVAVAEGVIAIIASAVCCREVCCNNIPTMQVGYLIPAGQNIETGKVAMATDKQFMYQPGPQPLT